MSTMYMRIVSTQGTVEVQWMRTKRPAGVADTPSRIYSSWRVAVPRIHQHVAAASSVAH